MTTTTTNKQWKAIKKNTNGIKITFDRDAALGQNIHSHQLTHHTLDPLATPTTIAS